MIMEILAYSYRGELRDLIYTGNIAVVDYQGKLLYSYGDPYKVAFARSSAKPMQAMVAVESGAVDAYGLTEEELALLCASHGGEEFHVRTVRAVLKKAGLDESYLQCGVHYPLYKPDADKMMKEGVEPTEVYCNCSGKHSGMLITCRYKGESLDDYYVRSHPHQKRITQMIGDICCYDPEKIVLGTDGCGVPVHALPLYNFAWGMARMANGDVLGEQRGPMAKRITKAMTAYPKMVSGTGRIDAAIMETFGGNVFAKSGADGYYIVGIKDKGIGIAVKIDDGNGAVRDMVVCEVLRQLGYINEQNEAVFAPWSKKEVYNHKKELVGHTVTDFTLHKGE
ncbi:MAG: asparaginase [Ruminococcaceae bacterium]|jgi:L-asparaginase II|nr:asparaginase [Oscillospiraceae bacterium]